MRKVPRPEKIAAWLLSRRVFTLEELQAEWGYSTRRAAKDAYYQARDVLIKWGYAVEPAKRVVRIKRLAD